MRSLGNSLQRPRRRQHPPTLKEGCAMPLSATPRGGNRVRRISACPRHIRGRPVSRGNIAAHHPQEYSKLRPMVRRVQNAPPEDPDTLALNIEEGHNLHPPWLLPLRKELEPRPSQL